MLIKHIAIILFSLLLTSCGFRPIYGESGIGKRLSQVKIGNIDDRDKIPTRELIALRSTLDQEFNWGYASTIKKYVLNITYYIYSEEINIQSNSIATRNNLKDILNYILSDIETGKIIEDNNLIGVEGFEISDSPFSDFVSKEETAIRIMKLLVSELKLRIAASI